MTDDVPQSELSGFNDLIRRVREGDEDAARELVVHYEPAIRRIVRVRLADRRLGRVLDSMDICQSVMKSFFVRTALGQYELDSPDQLLQLLATMARNKLSSQANQQRAARRDVRRVEGGFEAAEVAGHDATASRQLAARDLLQEARRRFSADELRLLELREEGRDWAGIALDVGGTPEGLRKRLARAVGRVAEELGLDEDA